MDLAKLNQRRLETNKRTEEMLGVSKLSSSTRWWLVSVVVFLLVIVVVYLSRMLSGVLPTTSPMEWGWLVQVAHGENLYPATISYVDGQTLLYTPLYFLFVGNLMKVFGITPIVSKVVSTICVFVTALLIYYVGRKLSDRKAVPIVPAVLFMLYPAVINWAVVQTMIDLMGLMLTTIGIVLCLNKKYLWSIIPFVLAIFTKQYFVSAPIAVSVYLLLKRDWKMVTCYVAGLIFLFVAGLTLGNWLTHGTFVTHVVGYLDAPTFVSSTNQASYLARTVGGTLVCLAYLAPVLILTGYGIWKTRTLGLVGIFLIVSLVVLLVTIGKAGSGTNYTFDALVAGCCLSSLVLGKKEEVKNGIN